VSVVTGSLKNKGKLDLAVTNDASGTVSVLFDTGTGTFVGAPTNVAVGINPHSVAIGDFNRDGKLDLAVANGPSNDVSILLNLVAGGPGGPVNQPPVVTNPVGSLSATEQTAFSFTATATDAD